MRSSNVVFRVYRRYLLMLLIVTSVCITWGNFQALNGHSQIRDDVAILPLIQVPLKTFLQVQKERGVQVPQNLSQMDQLQYDFQQVESYWKNHTLTAAEMAERYNIPETRRPECVPDSKTKVGWIPCRDCNREGDHGRIPKVIFQSWKSINLDSRICGMAVSWTEVNPEYDYLLFDDDIILRMIELDFGPNILERYKCLRVGAAKSDVWRLLAIYLFGGIYFDMDSTALPDYPFRTWGFGNHTVVTGKGGDGKPHQWGLIYTPKHPIIRDALVSTLNNLETKRGTRSVYAISYNVFQSAFRKYRPRTYDIMPGWKDYMGDRVVFISDEGKAEMLKHEKHWQDEQKMGVFSC